MKPVLECYSNCAAKLGRKPLPPKESRAFGYNDANGQWTYSPWLPSEDGIGTKIQTDWMKRVREIVDYVVGQRLLKKGVYILGHKKVVVR